MRWHLITMMCVISPMVGCSTVSKELDIARLPPPYRVSIHDEGRPISERDIVAGSQDAQNITQWLESNKSGWAPTYVTYAPSRIVHGDSFSLNFTNNMCIVNYDEGQFYKKANASVLGSLFDK